MYTRRISVLPSMEKILIYKYRNLRDLLLAFPVAQALRNGYPDAEITWATHARYESILECNTAIDSIQLLRKSRFLKFRSYTKKKYDLVLNLDGDFLSSLAIRRYQYNRSFTVYNAASIATLFSSKVVPDSSSTHVTDRYVDVARAAGGRMHAAEFPIQPLYEDINSIRSKLNGMGIIHNFVLLNPEAEYENDSWEMYRYLKLMQLLADRGIVCILVGKNTPYLEYFYNSLIDNKLLNVYSLAGKINLKQLVALVSLSNACIGMDGLLVHLAASMKVPAISIYSSTNPEVCCPYGQISRCLFDKRGVEFIPVEAIIDALDVIFTRIC